MTLFRLPDDVGENPLKLTVDERNSCVVELDNVMMCERTLQIGFFFDGTRNNMKYDELKRSHSNVARLFHTFDENRHRGEERQYRYRIYVPGVGTEFWKSLGDAGVGLHAQAGAATAWGGEARINWALLQLQNILNIYVTKDPLTTEPQDRALVKRMSTDINLPQIAESLPAGEPPTPHSAEDCALRGQVSAHQSLQAVASTQWRDCNTDGRRKVLAERRARLRSQLQAQFRVGLPRIVKIRLHVFGFSRGAAAARVFVNWLRDVCDEPTGPMRVCGVPMQVDFLGLFDTVASVGAAQGWLEDLATGHGGWGQRRDLRIPDATVVRRCLHLVSGHEVRGSFPVDAAAGGNVEEVVYPGVHSDLGGGYRPGEQGRGLSDDAKLSQIPLCHMYRAAIAAGVPLMNIPTAPTFIQNAFKVSPALIGRFNAYMAAVRTNGVGEGGTQALVQLHYRHYLHWRRYRLGKHGELPALRACSRQDRTDVLLADQELEAEWALLLKADEWNRSRHSPWLSGYLGMLVELGLFINHSTLRLLAMHLGSLGVLGGRAAFDDLPGGPLASLSPGVASSIDALVLLRAFEAAAQSKWSQWHGTQTAWGSLGAPAPAICALLEQDVHDSRAWFKPLGADDDVWDMQARERLGYLLQKERARKPADWQMYRPVEQQATLTDKEKRELEAYRQRMRGLNAREGTLPDDALPTQPGGREFYQLWGYLRWRTVYQDPYMDLRQQYPALAGADRSALLSRKRQLEAQAKGLDEQIHTLQKSIEGTVNVGGGWGALAGGGAGGFPTAAVNDLQGLYRAKAVVEQELKAVNTFLEELGPAPWWDVF